MSVAPPPTGDIQGRPLEGKQTHPRGENHYGWSQRREAEKKLSQRSVSMMWTDTHEDRNTELNGCVISKGGERRQDFQLYLTTKPLLAETWDPRDMGRRCPGGLRQRREVGGHALCLMPCPPWQFSLDLSLSRHSGPLRAWAPCAALLPTLLPGNGSVHSKEGTGCFWGRCQGQQAPES